MRFSVVKEPTGLWSVYDEVFELPAEVNGRLSVGLTRHEAERISMQANRDVLRWRPTAARHLEVVRPLGL